jgi:hypothetical protein
LHWWWYLYYCCDGVRLTTISVEQGL